VRNSISAIILVDQDHQFIPQALIVVLVAFTKDALEGLAEREDCKGVLSNRLNGWLANHLNDVPYCFNRNMDDI